MKYLIYLVLGLLPSLIWLSFYLKKDSHPEPNSMVIKIFLWGILIAPLAVIFEMILTYLLHPEPDYLKLISENPQGTFLKIILAATLVPAIAEETLKYLVVRIKILKNSVFDEPIDAMLYCVIAGLGFAAIENIITIFSVYQEGLATTLSVISFRFLGATLVHALAGAMVGYWVALGILYTQKRKRYLFIGLTIAILFHSCYNFFITLSNQKETKSNELLFLLFLILLLSATGLLVSSYFNKLKKQQAICQTN